MSTVGTLHNHFARRSVYFTVFLLKLVGVSQQHCSSDNVARRYSLRHKQPIATKQSICIAYDSALRRRVSLVPVSLAMESRRNNQYRKV